MARTKQTARGEGSTQGSTATFSQKRKSPNSGDPENAEMKLSKTAEGAETAAMKVEDDRVLDSNANITGRSQSNLGTGNAVIEIETEQTLTPKEAIASVLNDCEKPTVHAVGALDERLPLPYLVIDGFGFLPLPVNGLTGSELVKYLERSPYGHGEKTITDLGYRNSYQIGPEGFKIKNDKFTDAVNEIVGTVAEQFFFSPSSVSAKPYKFLFYEPGGFVKPHKDTEKDPGMFATLIIQLPSVFTGGQFLVKHNGETKTFDLSQKGCEISSFYVAHFASCTHELSKIVSGYRAALVYNLCWTGDVTTISNAPSYDRLAVAATLRGLISSYLEESMRLEYPRTGLRLVWLLEHEYTDDSLKTQGQKALKGKDAFVCQQLLEMNKNHDEDALFKILLAEAAESVRGNCATHDWGHERGYSSCKMDSGSDVYTDMELTNLVCVSESKPGTVPACPFERLAIDPVRDVVNFVEDETFWGKDSNLGKCEGYTGNAGAPLNRWYSRRVLVVYFKAKEDFIHPGPRPSDQKYSGGNRTSKTDG